MALVSEPGSLRNGRKRLASASQLPTSEIDPDLAHILSYSNAKMLAELPREVVRGDMAVGGDLIQRQPLMKAFEQ